MDIVSIMIFFIYVVAILIILVYISPILATFVLVIVPVASVLLLYDRTTGFFEEQQFAFGNISIQNIHILLMIWSAIIAVVASTEIISWYLLVTEKPKQEIKETEKPVAAQAPPKPVESQKSLKVKVENALLNLGKIMSGKKS